MHKNDFEPNLTILRHVTVSVKKAKIPTFGLKINMRMTLNDTEWHFWHVIQTLNYYPTPVSSDARVPKLSWKLGTLAFLFTVISKITELPDQFWDPGTDGTIGDWCQAVVLSLINMPKMSFGVICKFFRPKLWMFAYFQGYGNIPQSGLIMLKIILWLTNSFGLVFQN